MPNSLQLPDCVNEVLCSVPRQFTVQDYLECVGRLQDHGDILDDLRKDLLNQAPVGASMEELQIQTEEWQVRNRRPRLAGPELWTASSELVFCLFNPGVGVSALQTRRRSHR